MPEDYEYEVDGLYYKVGVHGLLFVWRGQWMKSNRDLDEIKKIIELTRRREAARLRHNERCRLAAQKGND